MTFFVLQDKYVVEIGFRRIVAIVFGIYPVSPIKYYIRIQCSVFLRHHMATRLTSSPRVENSVSHGEDGERITTQFGVDPGTVNCGIAEYDFIKEEAVHLERLQFRKSRKKDDPKKETDIGNAKLIETVSQYIIDNRDRFAGKKVFIEDQQSNATKKEGKGGWNNPAIAAAQEKIAKEVLAVQHVFQTMLGLDCVPVSAHQVKAHFPEIFPALPGCKRNSKKQYAADKRNAVKRGREEVPDQVRQEYETKNPQKKDDAYDAYFIAKFGAERRRTKEGNINELIMDRGPKKKPKNYQNPRPQTKRRQKNGRLGKDTL